MKNLHTLDEYRLTDPQALKWLHGWEGDDAVGIFMIPSPVDLRPMCAIASADDDWEHVSVSRQRRAPNWPEMSYIKDLFFEPTETVMQLHVPLADHVNNMPHCLHLWRPMLEPIPRPPARLVGDAKVGIMTKEQAEAYTAHPENVHEIIKAMRRMPRDPDEAMIEAGCRLLYVDVAEAHEPAWRTRIASLWRMMWDARK